ncbi:MAG: DUF2339 domain-containing protein [bacterium]|nr:DUF2339 domain-containing protein [bacterium]
MNTTPARPDPTVVSVSFMDRFEETAFKWGGLIMIFLAVAFAMGIAIDHGLYTPPLRVATGILIGAGLIAVGLVTYLGRPVFGQSLQGVGLAVLFLSLFAGHQMFAVISYQNAMTATVVVTGLSFWLASRRGDSALAAIGLLGGLAAPFVLTLGGASTGAASSVALYAVYASTLLLAAAALYFMNGWGSLLLTAGLLAVTTFSSIVYRLDPGDGGRAVVQVGLTAVALALWLAPVVRTTMQRSIQVSRHSIDRQLAHFFEGAELGAVIWAPAATVVATSIIWSLTSAQLGAVALAAAVLVSATGLTVRRDHKILGLTHFVAASGLLATASVLLLDGSALQLALAGQAFASLVVGRHAKSPVLTTVGGIIALPASTWAVSEIVDSFVVGLQVEPARLVAHVIIIGFVAVGALLETTDQIRRTLAAVAYVLFGTWLAEVFIGVLHGPAFTTASWILLAATTAWVGLRTESKPVIQVGLATVLLAVAKLLTTDLVQINAVGRTMSSFVAGVVLVGFGYSYPAMRELLSREEEKAARPFEHPDARR